MFTFAPGCIGIGHRLRWTLDSALLELRMLLVPATISCVLKWGKRYFFFEFEWAAVLAVLSESTSVLSFAVDQKTTPWSGFRKSLCQILHFRISRCSALNVRMCCNYDRPIRFHTRLNLPNVCALRTPESIWTHFCVPNSRGRHPASLQSKKSWKCPSVLYVRCWIAGLRCTWRRTRRNFWHNRQPGTLV